MPLSNTDRRLPQKTTATYTFTLVDENDAAIALTNLSTLTLTLYNKRDGTIINSRNAQDVKNANNVTVHATSGLVTWSIQANDTIVVDTNLRDADTEEHVALFEYSWNSGAQQWKYEEVFEIEVMEKSS